MDELTIPFMEAMNAQDGDAIKTLATQASQEQLLKWADAAVKRDDPLSLRALYGSLDTNYYAFLPRDCARYGSLNCLKTFEPFLTLYSEHLQQCMMTAAVTGHTDCLEYLLTKAHSSTNYVELLKGAASNGMSDCLLLLIPHSPTNSSEPLCWAVINQEWNCVDLLLPVSDSQQALQSLMTTQNTELIEHFQALINAQEKQQILNEINPNAIPRGKRKI